MKNPEIQYLSEVENASLGTKTPAAGGKEVWGPEPPASGDFYDFSTKIKHF